MAATLLCGAPAWADVISPDVASCQGGAKGRACDNMGTAGHCAPAHCCRLDYSQGSPPKGSICHECLKCVPGPAPETFAPLPPLPPNPNLPQPMRVPPSAVPPTAPGTATAEAPVPFPAANPNSTPASTPASPPAAPESEAKAAPAAAPVVEPAAVKAGCDTSSAPSPLGGLGLLAGLGVAFGLWRSRRR
jgi:pyruvate/2-oxoglutarate dehydrogenase complex dihydrolipoamide acyltransferase (E2) component